MKKQKKLKLMFLITNKELVNKVTDYLKSKGIETYFTFYGKGSASVSVLEYLGIGESEKSIIVYPSSEVESNIIMESIQNSEYLKNTIAFKVPVKGISSINILNYFLKEE